MLFDKTVTITSEDILDYLVSTTDINPDAAKLIGQILKIRIQCSSLMQDLVLKGYYLDVMDGLHTTLRYHADMRSALSKENEGVENLTSNVYIIKIDDVEKQYSIDKLFFKIKKFKKGNLKGDDDSDPDTVDTLESSDITKNHFKDTYSQVLLSINEFEKALKKWFNSK